MIDKTGRNKTGIGIWTAECIDYNLMSHYHTWLCMFIKGTMKELT